MAFITQVSIFMVAILQTVYGQSCGGSLTGSGRITSPGYPGGYSTLLNCQWNLTANEATGTGNAVSLFIEELNIEQHGDAVEIYSEGILMKRYQESTPAHKAVYGRSITIVLRTGERRSNRGFSIFFNSTGPECGTACSISGCSYWTPNFPHPYPKGSHCEWKFSHAGGIAFQPTALSATPFTGELKIASSYNGVMTNVALSSPSPMPTVALVHDFVNVNFTSDRCRTAQGFLLSLAPKVYNLRGQLFGQGRFSTLGYPDSYMDNSFGVWRLTANAGQRVQLTIIDLRVENIFDYVRIYSDNQLVKSYTGSSAPFNLTLGSTVFVEFQSDAESHLNGLSGSFISV